MRASNRLPAVLLLIAAAGCASRGDPRKNTGPKPPASLVHYVTGDDRDVESAPGGGLILMGGGTDVDAAFEWASARAASGDVVILRTTGADGYNDYLFSDIGGFDSVETMLVTTRMLADDEYVAWRVAHAELIFLAGGEQWTYLDNWKGTALETAIQEALARGAILGGTSAGLAVMGEMAFSAENGTVVSAEALADPYDALVALDTGFLAIPALANVVTDSHFGARDRMGRLIAFVARAATDSLLADPAGLGVDEETALVIAADGEGEVLGAGNVYVVRLPAAPDHCVAGDPLAAAAEVRRLVPGATAAFPGADTAASPYVVVASNGSLQPADPY